MSALQIQPVPQGVFQLEQFPRIERNLIAGLPQSGLVIP
jgi:hypothetical protein